MRLCLSFIFFFALQFSNKLILPLHSQQWAWTHSSPLRVRNNARRLPKLKSLTWSCWTVNTNGLQHIRGHSYHLSEWLSRSNMVTPVVCPLADCEEGGLGGWVVHRKRQHFCFCPCLQRDPLSIQPSIHPCKRHSVTPTICDRWNATRAGITLLLHPS